MGDPKPLTSKLDVNVESIKDLTANLREDADAFRGEMNAWGKTDSADHPMHAQVGRFPGYLEGQYVFENNFYAGLDASAMAMSIGNALMFLQMGADNIAMAFGGEDAMANVKLKQIEEMFPEKPFKAPGSGDGTAPLKDWVQIGNQGWDTNKDGKVDIAMPGTTDKSGNPTAEQRKTGVKDADGTQHGGYEQVFQTGGKGTGENSDTDFQLSGAGQRNLASNTDQEVILAPGEFGQQPGGGQPSTGAPPAGTLA
jgi:hypothetical protein